MWALLVFVLIPTVHLGNKIDFSKNTCTKMYDYPISFASKNCYHSTFMNSETIKQAALGGYGAKPYSIQTPDGYIITLYRLISWDYSERKGQPVLLQHGISGQSTSWLNLPNKTIAFMLANQGYDVWIGNLRGTLGNRDHTTIKSSSEAYWTFNIDTLMENDIRSILYRIYNETNQKIVYIGHSMGSTLGFMFASEYPEEAQALIKGFVALAPIIYFDPKPATALAFKLIPTVAKILRFLGIYRINKNVELVRFFLRNVIKLNPYFFMTLKKKVFGSSKVFTPEYLQLFYFYFSDTVCMQTIMQYAQMHQQNAFTKYDYGRRLNMKKYGQLKPPVYNLGNVTLPTYMFYGRNDGYISNNSVTRVYDEIGSVEKCIRSVPFDNNDKKMDFGHTEFIVGEDIDLIFNYDLLKYIKKLSLF